MNESLGKPTTDDLENRVSNLIESRTVQRHESVVFEELLLRRVSLRRED
jgi:hypothetical protein